MRHEKSEEIFNHRNNKTANKYNFENNKIKSSESDNNVM